jgi:hypothetical protein
VVFNDVRARDAAALVLDPQQHAGFPRGFVVSERAGLDWSEDNARVFFSIIPQTAVQDTARRRSTDSVPDVDVWHTRDLRIQSVQMNQANSERNFTFRQAYDVARRAMVTLTDSAMRDIQVSADGRWAVGRDNRAYIRDYGNNGADIYRVDLRTGERTRILEKQLVGRHMPGLSPFGNHFLYWKDDRYQLYDLASGTSRTLGGPAAPSFADTNFDNPGPRPPFGVEGWSADGRSVIVSHEYDVWVLPLDGSAARNLTGGAGTRNETRFSLVRTEPVDPFAPRALRAPGVYDLSRPITLSAYGEYTKKAGYYRIAGGRLTEVVYDDAAFSTP